MTGWNLLEVQDYGLLRHSLCSFLAMTEKYVLKVKSHYGLLRSLLLSRNDAVVSILSLRENLKNFRGNL